MVTNRLGNGMDDAQHFFNINGRSLQRQWKSFSRLLSINKQIIIKSRCAVYLRGDELVSGLGGTQEDLCHF